MSIGLAIVIALVGLALGLGAGFWLPPHGRRPSRERPATVRQILLPFTGTAISRRAFEAAVRLAKAENATIMPAFLVRVPRQLPLDTALPIQCGEGMPLLEAIEQRASRQGITVDARVGRGRSYRDALRHLLAAEHFDRVIVSATESGPSSPRTGGPMRVGPSVRTGLTYDDLEWLLERVPAEVMILRPAPDDTRRISANGLAGHF